MAGPGVSRPQHASAFEPEFPALFGGDESPDAVRLRRELFETAWPVLEDRIQHVLRDANQNTLDEVTAFLQQAAEEDTCVLNPLPVPPAYLSKHTRICG